ncbi:Dynein light chain roadblock, partial [Crotalus adamanteus]
QAHFRHPPLSGPAASGRSSIATEAYPVDAARLEPGRRSHGGGIPIRTTLDNSTTVQYAGLLHQLTMKAKSTVRDIDPQNDLTFLRIRSKKHEIMVAPGVYILMVLNYYNYDAMLKSEVLLLMVGKLE